MKTVDLSIITVAFNSQNEIKKWVESIEKTVSKYSYEMIISDNSPNSETEKVVLELQKKHPELIYIHNHGNLGFSKGNNVAIKKAKGKYFLFLNPDMEVGEGTIDGALSFLVEHNDAGSATPAVYLPNNKLDDSCHRGFPTPWNSFTYFSGLSRKFPRIKLFAGYNMTYLDLTKVHTIDALAGSFLIISRDLGEKLKWWDEDYFFYGEDIDFCYRIQKAGYKIYYLPEYKAIHYKGMSSGIKDVSKEVSKATIETRIWATNQRFKAMEIFYKKHYKKKYPWLVNTLVSVAIKTKHKMALKNLQS
ncbi:MAG TPA: glycosyltransferase family 2 protein [Candidatus Levybacteria bacterium]|nr:glycosyltransferase family 2 protein [Candidatus Levybacteria bacterium]